MRSHKRGRTGFGPASGTTADGRLQFGRAHLTDRPVASQAEFARLISGPLAGTTGGGQRP